MGGPSTVLEGRYRLDVEIGRGGMGVVWRGTQLALDRPVAVKLLSPGRSADRDAVLRFRREALAASRLAHPGIVGVLDAGVADGVPYLVMELIEGESLDRYVAVRGRLSVDRALELTRQIADALAAAHGAGIVHRDVKPANVLVGHDGRARLVDFGLASLMAETDARLTSTGIIVGTPDYLAPELARGHAPDARADVYALGATLYEMLTGAPPFDRGDPLATMLAHLHDELVAPSAHTPSVPPAVDALVRELLAKSRDDRPHDGGGVRDRIDALAPRSAPAHDAIATVIAIARASEDEGRLGALPPSLDVARAPSGELLVIVARSEDALATIGRLGAVASGAHRGPIDRVGGVALGEAVRGAIRLARLASPGQSMISAEVHDDVGLGWIARLRHIGQRVSIGPRATDVFALGEGEAAFRVPSERTAEGRSFRCVCGVESAVVGPLADAPNVRVRCAACSGLCELMPAAGPAVAPTERAPLVSQALALLVPARGDEAEDAEIIALLSDDE